MLPIVENVLELIKYSRSNYFSIIEFIVYMQSACNWVFIYFRQEKDLFNTSLPVNTISSASGASLLISMTPQTMDSTLIWAIVNHFPLLNRSC